MSHDTGAINIDHLIEAEPIRPELRLSKVFFIFIVIGVLAFVIGIVRDPKHLWGAYFVNVVFWMGLSAGAVIVTAIFQIVRATWAAPVRRIAEANVFFLPWAYVLLLCTYFGKSYLFPWATGPMPGREWWMQPNFVYGRMALLLGLLFFLMWRYVRMSLRGDLGFLKEKAKNERWKGYIYDSITKNWSGSAAEVTALQRKLSWNAPVLIMAYALIYSLFSFEMIMGMDKIWYANMFGGFVFIGNIYLAWATIAIMVIYHARLNKDYGKTVTSQQLWDLGKLTFGFCMLWGYLFFAQFLPQWYTNMPEETQWMILRTREGPWNSVGWITFSLCFVIPFILLLSEDLKRTPVVYGITALLIFFGIWLEKFLVIMPQLYPTSIPFGLLEIGLFLGFLGAYALCIQQFLARYPFIPVSHPLTRGETEW